MSTADGPSAGGATGAGGGPAGTPPCGSGPPADGPVGGAPEIGTWVGAGWVDLLSDLSGADVLVVGEVAPGADDGAVRALVEEGARVTCAATAAAVTAQADDGRSGPAGGAGHDVVVVREVRPTPREWAPLASLVRPDGRLVVLADVSTSPLGMVDRVRGRSASGLRLAPQVLDRRLAQHGFRVERRFGLLRSARAPVLAMDLGAPSVARAIQRAAGVRLDLGRRTLLRVVEPAVASAGPMVLPGQLVVARRTPRAPLDADAVTGRIGHQESDERIVVHGEPPWGMEKRYLHVADADAEVSALVALAASSLVPVLLGRPGPRRVRQSWIQGQPLAPAGLRPGQALRWAERACDVLGVLQARTLADDGSVLVHGDFWLGNVLVEDGDVVAVVDWTGAHRGSPTADVDHLVDSLVDGGHLPPDHASTRAMALRARVARARDLGGAPADRAALRPIAGPRRTDLDVEIVRSRVERDAIADDWQRLADVAGGTACTQPWWAGPWYDHVGVGRPMVVVVRDAGSTRAVFPLHERGSGPLRVARLAGHGLGAVGQVLADPDDRDALSAVWEHLRADTGLVLDLRNARAGPGLDAGARTRGRAALTPADRCPWFDVPDDLDRYLATRSPSLRRTLAKGERRLARDGRALTVEVATDRAGLSRVLPDAVDVYDAAERHRRRGHLLRGRWAPFLRSVLPTAADQGRLHLAIGRIDGRAVTFDLGFTGTAGLELFLGRYDPEERACFPGHLALRAIAQDPAVAALGRLLLGLGDDVYKRSWTDDGDDTYDVIGAGGPIPRRLAVAALDRLAQRRG